MNINRTVEKLYGKNLSPEKRSVVRQDLESIMSNKAFQAHLARILLSTERKKLTDEELQNFVVKSVQRLQKKGQLRIPPEMQAVYLDYIIGLAHWLPSTECKEAFFGDSNTSFNMEHRYAAAMSLEDFRKITHLNNESLAAELRGYPAARVNTPDQNRQAKDAHQKMMSARLRQRLTQAELRSIAADMGSVPPALACSVIQEHMQAMRELPEPIKTWQLSRFVETFQ